MTKHAMKRSQQRGISLEVIELIMQLGEPIYKPGGAIELRIPRKKANNYITQFKKIMNGLERAAGNAVILLDNTIITVYHEYNN